jgi:hypothetical protein
MNVILDSSEDRKKRIREDAGNTIHEPKLKIS